MNPEFQPQITQMNTDDPAAEKHLRPSVSSAAKKEPAPKISVIVPVYKVEKYLPECIESVLAQTFTDFELILVDDGSPDNSGAICDAYAKKDSRIRVFHKENGGVSSARRLGVERSRGEWIMFVDGDDVLPNTALAVLLGESAEPEVDLIEGLIQNFRKQPPSTNVFPSFEKKSVLQKKYLEGLIFGKWLSGPVAKIFRRDILIGDVMNIPAYFSVGEDALMLLRAGANGLRRARKISTIVYFYRRFREGASTNGFHLKEEYARRIYMEQGLYLENYHLSPKDFSIFKAGCALIWLRRFISEGVKFDRKFWLYEVRATTTLDMIKRFPLPCIIRFFAELHLEFILTLSNTILCRMKELRYT